jgi:hypothetical protein
VKGKQTVLGAFYKKMKGTVLIVVAEIAKDLNS